MTSTTHPDGPTARSAPPPGPATPRPRPRRRAAWWLLPMAAVIILVTARALSAYVPPDLHTSRVPPRSELHYALLLAHIFTATVAVLTGIAQFWPWLRRHHPAVHRRIGRTYFFAGVFPSAVIGIPVALLAPTGLSNELALLVLDILWIITALAGYRTACRRRYADHRTWMIRNFALTLVAITSRLLQPAIEYLTAAQLPDPVSYAGNQLTASHDIASATAWLGLVLNLIAAEYLIQRRGKRATRQPAARQRGAQRPAAS
ncbi:DUF2306 domain-containing protein [Streptomyces sp. NPDC048483]|uniref:DUF2306 domain-containing protein n=1 Tax=Streptomyces sp. NPDC048483 TaxID=3154927 RepID=UPI0034393274